VVHFTLKLDDGSTAESTRNGKPALFRLGIPRCLKGLQQLLGLKEAKKRFRWSRTPRFWYAGPT
jgi:FKBP-type peptidyl-prolyl cis-trans isomerase SlpA